MLEALDVDAPSRVLIGSNEAVENTPYTPDERPAIGSELEESVTYACATFALTREQYAATTESNSLEAA